MNVSAVLKPEHGILQADIERFNKYGFTLHFIPDINLLSDDKTNTLSKERRMLLERTTNEDKAAYISPGRWIFVEDFRMKREGVPWIAASDLFLFGRAGIPIKRFLKELTVTKTKNFLLDEAFPTRFCFTREEVSDCIKYFQDVSEINSRFKIRLLHYVEYFYLATQIFPDWNNNKTWEWLEDTLPDGQYLATGYQTWNIIGFDPPEYWSTILGFRLAIEVIK